METTRGSSLRRRILALFLTAVMCISLVQITALAEEYSQDQVGPNYSYDSENKDWSTSQDPDSPTSDTVEKDGFQLTDSIEQAEENKFNVTLKVKTNQKITTVTSGQAAHVVLVIDVSNSMKGGKIKKAREAAKNFVESFFGENASKDNKVAVVSYSKYAYTKIKLSDQGKKQKIKKAIHTVQSQGKDKKWDDDGGTNIQAGIRAAQNILSDGHQDGVKDIVLLLSDGEPTYSYRLQGTAKGTWGWYWGWYIKSLKSIQVAKSSDEIIGSGKYYVTSYPNLALTVTNQENEEYPDNPYDISYGAGNFDIDDDGYANHGFATVWQADQAKKTGTEFYSILLDGKNAGWHAESVMKRVASSKDGTDDHYLPASDASKLGTCFQTISKTITEGQTGSGTTVTDPMGKFIQLDASGLQSDDPYVKVDNNTNTLTWTLSTEDTGRCTQSADGKGNTSYTYTLTYPITLDNLDSGFITKKDENYRDYCVSGPTTLRVGDKDEFFHVPSVHGLTGSLTFTKKDAHDIPNAKLDGAEFKLSCGKFVTTTTSNQDGTVTFSNIPSGHAYNLEETKAPENYVKSGKTSSVSVNYGRVSVTGDLVQGSGDNLYVTNELDSKDQPFTVRKVWLPKGNKGKEITASIYAQDQGIGNDSVKTPAATLTLKPENDFEGEVTLPTVDVKTGKAILYTAGESKSGDYRLVKSELKDHTFILTNVSNEEKTICVQKKWIGPKEFREPVEVQLEQNGQKYKKCYTLNSKNDWKQEGVSVPTYDDNGELYTYTAAEMVDGKETTGGTVTLGGHQYTVSTSGTTVTNTIQQEATTVSGHKTWNVAALGDKEKDALRATITLTGSDGSSNTETVSVANPDYRFENLPKYDLDNGGKEITYSVQETAVSDKNVTQTAETFNQSGGSDFTNTLTDNVIFRVNKVWKDDDNALGVRPDHVSVNVLGNGKVVKTETLNATQPSSSDLEETVEAGASAQSAQAVQPVWDETNSTCSFTLPKYDAKGALITYTVQEGELDDNGQLSAGSYYYTPTVVKGDDGNYTITNTLGGKEKTITLSKNWVDSKSDADRTASATITLTGSDGSTQTWTTSKTESKSFQVPAFTGDGKVITYTAKETSVPEGYDSKKDGDTFTNTIQQENDITVSGAKTWKGEGDHPDVTFTLYKNGAPTDQTICSTDTGYSDEGFRFTGLEKYTFKDNTCTLNTYSIYETMSSDNPLLLQCYGYGGTPIQGTQDDEGVYQFTNEFTPGNVAIKGQKTWYGGSGAVTVGLYGGDTQIATTTTGEDGTYQFAPPEYDSHGNLISYAVYEMNGEKPVKDGGTVSINGKNFVVTYTDTNITNTLQQEKVSIPVTKVWAGPAAKSAKFELLRDGAPIGNGVFLALTKKDATSDGNWSGTFPEQKKYNPERTGTYRYSVKEVGTTDEDGKQSITLDNRTYTVEKAGNTFINTVIDPNNGTYTVHKDWNGGDNTSHLPVTVKLYAGDVPTNHTATLDSTDHWTDTFTDLPLYDSNTHQTIAYHVREVDGSRDVGDKGTVQLGKDHYTVNIQEGEKAEQIDKSYDAVITNTWTSTESYHYQVIRHYTADGVDAGTVADDWIAGEKSASISLDAAQKEYLSYKGRTYSFGSGNVTQTGTDASTTPVLPTQTTSAFKFDLVKYNAGDNSYKVELWYHYTTPYTPPSDHSGSTDTTSTSLTVDKVWEDEDSQDRPSSVTVQLYKNNLAYGEEETLNSSNHWSYTWESLAEGNTWTVDEINVPDGYTASVSNTGDEWTITNTLAGIDIPDTPNPGSDQPDEPSHPGTPGKSDETGTATIGETGTPKAGGPTMQSADVPRTGDMLATWIIAVSVSGLGLTWLIISEKKRRDQENENQ